MTEPACDVLPAADEERRFGGLDRLFGAGTRERLAQAHVMVAGIGGVGSWCAEALARCGVGRLTLVDLDHIADSNINRQIHALGSTVGQAKVEAMAARIADIHPGCDVQVVDDFIGEDNVAALLDARQADRPVLVDCTDQARAKLAMILACRERAVPLLVCGAAGGRTSPLGLQAGDLATAMHDALLARLRSALRRDHGYPRAAPVRGGKRPKPARFGVEALWFTQEAVRPGGAGSPQGLSCAGYGSVVTVTATMGLAAADWALRQALSAPVA